MDSATEDLILQRIHELVFDEDKIVTCASLAANMKIDLLDAKTAFNTFVKDSKEITSPKVHFTYILSGILYGKGLSIYLVKDTELKEKKALFENTFTEVVYSIQKHETIDFNAVALSHPHPQDWQGIVRSQNCVKRDLPKKIQAPIATKAESSNLKPTPPSTSKPRNEEKSPKPEEKQVKEPVRKPTKAQSKPNGAGIASFISKMPPKAIKTETSQEKEVEIEKMIVDEVPQEVKTNGVTKKRKKQSKDGQPSKKRKRIQQISDSDSDDIFGGDDDDNHSEDIIEKSDDELVFMPPVKAQLEPVKGKKLKSVDKTYLDEEGYMVTQTEYVFESVSEEEGPEIVKKVQAIPAKVQKKVEEPKETTKGKGGKGKNKKPPVGKQPTLMNFFKKV